MVVAKGAQVSENIHSKDGYNVLFVDTHGKRKEVLGEANGGSKV